MLMILDQPGNTKKPGHLLLNNKGEEEEVC